jgi:hypothetical protein
MRMGTEAHNFSYYVEYLAFTQFLLMGTEAQKQFNPNGPIAVYFTISVCSVSFFVVAGV